LISGELKDARDLSLGFDLEPGEYTATVTDDADGPRAHPQLGKRRDLIVARNREYVDRAVVLAEGDELALIPPVSGGAIGARPNVHITSEPLSIDEALALARLDQGHAPGGGV